MSRRDYMKKLHSQLVESWLKIRLEIRTMPTHIKNKISDILGLGHDEGQGQSQSQSSNGPQPSQAANSRKRRTCGLCHTRRRMTKSSCVKCNSAICGEHKVGFCSKCALQN